MANLTDAQQRDIELDLAKLAITSVFLEWGVGWFNLAPRARRGQLALAIMEYASGYTANNTFEGKYKHISKHGWTSQDCQEVLRIILSWSGGDFGVRMLDFAITDPAWLQDPIPALKRRMR